MAADREQTIPPAPEGAPPAQVAPGEAWKVLGGWLVVGMPAAWGVAQVVVKSMALFR